MLGQHAALLQASYAIAAETTRDGQQVRAKTLFVIYINKQCVVFAARVKQNWRAISATRRF